MVVDYFLLIISRLFDIIVAIYAMDMSVRVVARYKEKK